MARIKLAYVGGGSTRAPGTMVSFIDRAANFAGSEVVLIDLNEQHLQLVKKLTDKLVDTQGADLRISITTDRRAGLQDCDAVLASFRVGGFEARYLDETIPLRHGVIGQETQGPGGFFMALRSINVMKDIVADMEQVCPEARLFNYTNPVNLVAEAVTHHCDIPTVSLCEGPISSTRDIAEFSGLDPNRVDATTIGLNHGSWSVRHEYDGEDMMPLVRRAYEREQASTQLDKNDFRLLELAATMSSIPSYYFLYYYFNDEVLAELQSKPTTRAQDIMGRVPDYWNHYREQADSAHPKLDAHRSRGGLHELELAVDVMDALYNDRGEIWTVNVPNGGAISNFPADRVVEVPGYVDKNGIRPMPSGSLPRQVAGLVEMLGEYQALAAEAAWSGTRIDGIRALASHPLVFSLHRATAIYDDMAAAHRTYLPDRLLA